jgi:uncharacterized protein YuzE
MRRPKRIGFELSVSARDDGTLEALYISLSDAKVARTREILDDVLLADYSAGGKLVGIEILAPVKISKLEDLVEEPKRRTFRAFVRRAAPRELVEA